MFVLFFSLFIIFILLFDTTILYTTAAFEVVCRKKYMINNREIMEEKKIQDIPFESMADLQCTGLQLESYFSL